MNTPKYKRLAFEERVIIETLMRENKSKTFISKQLNRSTVQSLPLVERLINGAIDTMLSWQIGKSTMII